MGFVSNRWQLWLVAAWLAQGVIAGKDDLDPESLELALVEGVVSGNNAEGLFGNFSKNPTNTIKASTVLSGTVNETGCTPYKVPSQAGSVIVIVRRGNCSFVSKAQIAQDAGAVGLIVVSLDDYPIQMSGPQAVGIFVLSLGKEVGEPLLAKEHGIVLGISVYHPSLWNLSEVFVVLMATSLIVAGASFSTADMRKGSPMAQQAEEVVEMSTTEAWSLVFVMSGVLVLMFFFMKYLIYVIIVFFCFGGGSTLVQFGSIFLGHHISSLKSKAFSIPMFGPVTHAEVVACVPASVIVLLWFFLRNTPYGWPFQDIMGAGFLCLFQRTIRVPNIRVATVLLSCMFFFDIFWVFLSPIFFHKSVMVTVAKGGGTGESVPMLLLLPTIGDPLPGMRMLGFGDIAIPGLLISYLLRYDKLSRRGEDLRSGYFLPAVIGYACGLTITIAALCIMGIGQPALLYLVPCTLGTTILLSWCRGELGHLWDGQPAHLPMVGSPLQGDLERNPQAIE